MILNVVNQLYNVCQTVQLTNCSLRLVDAVVTITCIQNSTNPFMICCEISNYSTFIKFIPSCQFQRDSIISVSENTMLYMMHTNKYIICDSEIIFHALFLFTHHLCWEINNII